MPQFIDIPFLKWYNVRMNNLMQKIKKACVSLLALLVGCTGAACDISALLPSSGDASLQSSIKNDITSEESSDNDSTGTSDGEDETGDAGTTDDTDNEAFLEAGRIMDMAYALSAGDSLDGTYTLTGVVTEIDLEYKASKGVCLYMDVNEPKARELYCYQLKGSGADIIGKGCTITVSGTITNYKGTIEFNKSCTLVAYTLADGTQGGTDLPDIANDPYANISKSAFYANYTPATSNEDAYYRSLHGFMSGELTVPDQAPTLSAYRPKVGTAYLRNSQMLYADEGNAYVVTDVYGKEAFTVYKEGGYITLEEVAAYVYAFGTYPKNYTTSKSTEPSESVWAEYLRLNHTAFSGDTSKYPYEPVLPNITGCGGKLKYYEMDIGTTGTDCDPDYPVEIYNNGSTITRGAARIVYGKNDLDRDGVFEANEFHLFYTYNHYNDFQEYLNYAGGWGETFGNITGGGSISSKYDYNPTDYVPVYIGELPSATTRTVFNRYFGS